MTALGLVLLLLGATLVVVEAHVPGGVAGVAGGLALVAGGIVAIAGAGGSLALAVPVGIAIGVGVAGWMLLAATKTAAARRTRIQAGSEALAGRVGTVRGWSDASGSVFVDGALWRARPSWPDDHLELNDGDPVVVERVKGLTLCVRKADRWELEA
jgi:membrane-bound ClpP family serine protease